MPEPVSPPAPLPRLAVILAAGWLVPGGGHFLQKKNYRGALLSGAILLTFIFGLLMRGYLFEPQTGDVLTTLIYTGGFLGDLSAGLPYLLAKMFGYNQPDIAGHVYDYGTKFLVCAGLLNLLALVDAWEIALGKKD
jgi:hypothetical protein